jgi:hypothetical protein
MTEDERANYKAQDPNIDFTQFDQYSMRADFESSVVNAAWRRNVANTREYVRWRTAPVVEPERNPSIVHQPQEPADPAFFQPQGRGPLYTPRDDFRYRGGVSVPPSAIQTEVYNKFIQRLVEKESAPLLYATDNPGNYEHVGGPPSKRCG